jgi:hypothetical protein
MTELTQDKATVDEKAVVFGTKMKEPWLISAQQPLKVDLFWEDDLFASPAPIMRRGINE